MSTNSILSGIAKDCSNMSASIGANKDLILINYFDFNKPATLSALNRQLNDDFNNKGGLTDIKLFEGAKQYVFEGTDYSVVPSVSVETKEDGNSWYSHSISFTVYNKSSEARQTLLELSKARVIAVTRDRSTGLYELFGAEQGLKLSGLERPYTGSQSSNFYSITIATPDIAVVKERSIGELSLKLDGVGGGDGEVIPPNDNLEYLLSLKEDKANKGQPNGYAPLDANAKVPAQFLNIVNDLTTGGATNLLSAEQGKLINERLNIGLDNIKTERIITLSNPVTRFSVCNTINSLPSFEIKDNEIPYFVTTTTEGEQGYKVELLGLGRGFYGQNGTAITASQIRISMLVDSGLAGINEILFLGNTARDKTMFFKHEGLESTYTSISTGSVDIVNGGRNIKITENGLQFRDSGRFGQSSLLPPTGTVLQTTANTLPNKSGFLAVSVNGVFADSNGNINISGGGSIPTWQQVLDVNLSSPVVETHFMQINVENTRMQLSNLQYAFEIETDKEILFNTAKGSIVLGNDTGIKIDGKTQPVTIQTNGVNTLLFSADSMGAIEINNTNGVYLQGRGKGVVIEGQGGSVNISGVETRFLNSTGVFFDTPVQTNQQIRVKSQINFYDTQTQTIDVATLRTERIFDNSNPINVLQTSGNFRTNGTLYIQNGAKFESNNGQGKLTNIASENVTESSDIYLPSGVKGDFTIITNINGVFSDSDGTVTLDLSGDAHTINEVLEKGSIAIDKTQIFQGTGATERYANIINHTMVSLVDSTGNDKASFVSDSIFFENTTSHFWGEIGVQGIVLNQNPLNPNFKTNLIAQYNDSDQTLSLPNRSGTLIISVNGTMADSNGNVDISGGEGSQGLQSVLNIDNVATDKYIVFKNSNSINPVDITQNDEGQFQVRGSILSYGEIIAPSFKATTQINSPSLNIGDTSGNYINFGNDYISPSSNLNIYTGNNFQLYAKNASFSVNLDAGGTITYNLSKTKVSGNYTFATTDQLIDLPSTTFDTILSMDAFGTEILARTFDRTTLSNFDSSVPSSKAVTTAVDTRQIKDKQITVSGNTTIDESWDGQTILFTSSGTITVPSTLPEEFSFNAITLVGVTISWAKGSEFNWLFGTPAITLEKTYLNFTRVGATSDLILAV